MDMVALLFHKSKKVIIFAIIAGLVGGASSAGLIALINSVISDPNSQVGIIILSFSGLLMLRLATNVTSSTLLIRLSQSTVFRLRILMSQRILASPLRVLEKLGAHRLFVTLTDDIQSISRAFLAIPSLCISAAIVISCLGYLCYLSYEVFALVLVFMLIGMVSYRIPVNKAVQHLKRARESEDLLFDNFGSITEGTKELKLHRQRRVAFLTADLHKTARSNKKHSINGMTIYVVAEMWGEFLFFLLIGLIIFAMPLLQQMDGAVMSGYVLTILYLIGPIETILNTLPTLGVANVAIKKINSLNLSSENLETSSKPVEEKPALKFERLELISVTHDYENKYNDVSFTLGPVDLCFFAGEITFIVGGNGSGKSTLAKIIVGLYTPEKGEIRIDGEKITNLNKEWYHQHFSAIFSDSYLFGRLHGMDNKNLDNRAKDYLFKLQLNNKVEVQNGAFSTIALSQGQRKRLALLIAYLEDRPIYIFDEWAAEQDPVFKRVFYTQILPDLKERQKSVIVISHDDRYFDMADRILKIEDGKVKQIAGYEMPKRKESG